jgi:hypothetical protein
MLELHYSDIISYAINRLATEFARDKQETLKGLRQYIERTDHHRSLGSNYYEEMDESGPCYAIRDRSGVAREGSEPS